MKALIVATVLAPPVMALAQAVAPDPATNPQDFVAALTNSFITHNWSQFVGSLLIVVTWVVRLKLIPALEAKHESWVTWLTFAVSVLGCAGVEFYQEGWSTQVILPIVNQLLSSGLAVVAPPKKVKEAAVVQPPVG